MSTRTSRLLPRRSPHEPERFFQPADRVTNLFEIRPTVWRRHVGTVGESDALIFSVIWDGDAGVARYAHGHEPETLRHADPADERAALDRTTRLAVAAELRRLVASNPHWPSEVRQVHTQRALDLTERVDR